MLPCVVFGQLVPFNKVPTKRDYILAKKYDQCYNSHRYNAKQRRAFTPFSKAITIKLISFHVPIDGALPGEENPPPYTPIAPDNFKINNERIIESKVLSEIAIDSLTDIMYNVGFTPMKIKPKFTIADSGASCYNPRNAILFIDANGVLTHYIEFCWECGRYYLSSSKIKNTTYCEQKLDMLKTFFLTQGIKYGTILPKKG